MNDDAGVIAEAIRSLARKHGNLALHCFWAFALGVLWMRGGDSGSSAVAVSLAGLQTFLVVAALGGFWLLRGEVRHQAAREAKTVARGEMKRLAQEVVPPIVRRALGDKGDLSEDAAQEISDRAAADIVAAVGSEDDG